MKATTNDKTFRIYLLFMILLTVFTVIINEIIARNSGILPWMILWSVLILGILHLFYHKLYLVFTGIRNKFRITKGLFTSTIFGGLILISLGIFSFLYTKSSGFSHTDTNTFYDIVFYSIIGVYLLLSLICAIIDSVYSKPSNKLNIRTLRIFGGSILFFGINWAACYSLYIVLLLGIGGWF